MQFGLDLEKEARAKQGLDRRRQLPVEQMEWEGAIVEENIAIKEFRQNLDYNLGKVRPPHLCHAQVSNNVSSSSTSLNNTVAYMRHQPGVVVISAGQECLSSN